MYDGNNMEDRPDYWDSFIFSQKLNSLFGQIFVDISSIRPNIMPGLAQRPDIWSIPKLKTQNYDYYFWRIKHVNDER